MNKNDEIKEFQNYLVAEALSKNQDPEKYVKELGEEGLKEAYKRFQAYKKKKSLKAAHGAKLQYFKSLKNQCAEDEEVVYFKKGGLVECGCKKKKGGEIPSAESGWKAKFKSKVTLLADATGSQGGFEKAKEVQLKNKELEREDKWRRGQIIVGKDIARGQKDAGPKAKVLDSAVPNEDIPSHDPKLKKGSRSRAGQASLMTMKCGGSTVKKFKAKCGSKMKKVACGSKMKKHQLGGSLNGIPFIKTALQKKV